MADDLKVKILKCPLCQARLIDAAKSTVTELIPEGEVKAGRKPDYYQKCSKCKRLIGIRKVS